MPYVQGFCPPEVCIPLLSFTFVDHNEDVRTSGRHVVTEPHTRVWMSYFSRTLKVHLHLDNSATLVDQNIDFNSRELQWLRILQGAWLCW